MNIFPLQKRHITNSRIIYGTTGLGGRNNFDPLTDGDLLKAERAVDAALEAGMTMFDHADIYTGGKAEEIFGSVLRNRPGLRERIVIQSNAESGSPTKTRRSVTISRKSIFSARLKAA